MSIKDLALVKLVSGAVKKGKDGINTLLKPQDSTQAEESVADTFNLAIGRNKKVSDRVEARSTSTSTTTKESLNLVKNRVEQNKKELKEVNKNKGDIVNSIKKVAGSKKEEKIALYTKDIQKHLGSVDSAFLEIIVKNLGPSIYRKDAESVACSDSKELDTVRNNFLIKKLGYSKDDKEMLDGEIKKVCESMKGTKIKYRATFYYTLAKNLKKESALS